MAEAEESVDELYGLDPNDFVAARNDLVKRLKKAGDKALAAEVAKLKRPTPAAWAVNQLARRHRDDLEELVRLGEALRDAQDRALAGDDPGDMRQAGRARRDAVARLAERADRLLVERGGAPGAHAGDVTATLEAASLDAEAGAAVLAGRLATELEPPSGFGLFDLTVAPAPPPEAQAGAGGGAGDRRAGTSGPGGRRRRRSRRPALVGRPRWRRPRRRSRRSAAAGKRCGRPRRRSPAWRTPSAMPSAGSGPQRGTPSWPRTPPPEPRTQSTGPPSGCATPSAG